MYCSLYTGTLPTTHAQYEEWAHHHQNTDTKKKHEQMFDVFPLKINELALVLIIYCLLFLIGGKKMKAKKKKNTTMSEDLNLLR